MIRADAGFSTPRILDTLEALNPILSNVDYVIGIAKNPRLLALAQPLMDSAKEHYASVHEKVRHFSIIHYAAESWSTQRIVVVKAEHHDKGANPRFVVTRLAEIDPKLIYDRIYCARGQCENYIKDFKNALRSDRLSCCLYKANFFRLLLHAAAYRLLHAIRAAASSISYEVAHFQLDTLRLNLLKVAAFVSQSTRRVWVRLPRAFPLAHVFMHLSKKLIGLSPG